MPSAELGLPKNWVPPKPNGVWSFFHFWAAQFEGKSNPPFSDTALFQAKALNNETDNASILLRLEVAVAAVHGFVQKWHGGTPKNNERHLVNRGSLAQEHLSCRAFPAFPDLSVRLWVAKRTRLSPPGPHWSCTAASQPERQNARMPYSTYTLSLSLYICINTLIIYI